MNAIEADSDGKMEETVHRIKISRRLRIAG